MKNFTVKILFYDGSGDQEGKEIAEIEDNQIKVQLDASGEPILFSSLNPTQTEAVFNTLGKRKIIEHITPGEGGRFEKIVGITIGTLMEKNESDQLRDHSRSSESTSSKTKGSTPVLDADSASADSNQEWLCIFL